MKIKCSYCDNYISDIDEKCPNCGAPNEGLKRVGNQVPKTIEELKQWYIDHNLPDENITRFFIGKDIKEARAFGIYKDDSTGNFVVYKNKDTGVRAIRYEGKDESYAVNELYLKLKEEIMNQKSRNSSGRRSTNTPKALYSVFFIWLFLFGAIFFIVFAPDSFNYSPGYYESNNNLYYLYDYCPKLHKDQCEFYQYLKEDDSWILVDDTTSMKKLKFGGKPWNGTNKLYSKYKFTRYYYQEDWYKKMHPPIPSKGYYNYNDNVYYYLGRWYIYQNGSWTSTSSPGGDITYYPENYYDSTSTSSDTYDFDDTSYYSDYYAELERESWSSSYDDDDDDWDSGSSWDSSDSWDSGDTDWGSDW